MKDTRDLLIRELLDTLEGFQHVRPGRKDYAIWAEYFRRRFKSLTKPGKRK